YLARVYAPFLVIMEHGNIHQTARTPRKRFAVAAKIKNNKFNTIWDYNDKKKLDDTFIIGYLARVYAPFLVIMEHGNIHQTARTPRKRFAVAAKIKVSNDTTVIVCPTRTINFFGAIVKKTNLIEFFEMTRRIETDINAEQALVNLCSNIAGFIIKHRDDSVEVTYINAVSNLKK
ncbi:hypothetical protein PCHCB_000502200, partial [Plasmodium chabaudi chabaudi]